MKNIILCALLSLPLTIHAQMSQQRSLSLQQAMQLGLKNRFDLKAEQYNIDLSENQASLDKKAWIPDVHAEGSVQYNTNLQPTYVPAGFAGFTEPEMLSFGAKQQSVFGLALEQPIFKPGINTNVKIAKAQLSLQQEKLRGLEIAVKSAIATAYLNVLLKKLQSRIAWDEEQRYAEYQILAKGRYDHGTLIKNDYLRTKLDYENAKVKTTTLEQDYQLALDNLSHQINLPGRDSIILSDSIENISFGNLAASNQNNAVDKRTEVRQLLLQQQENDLQLKRMHQNALPTISAFGYYAQVFQSQNFNYNESEWWAPHSYFGLKFSVPISANFGNKNNIRRYQLQQQQLLMQLNQEKTDISYQIQKATTDMQNTQQNMQSAKDNYKLSQQIYHNQEQQFAIGVFKYSDLLDTEKSLSQAEQNYIRSVYDFMLASLQYQKATGNL